MDLYGIKPENNYFNAGAGLKISGLGPMDLFFNYDLNASSSYTSHQIAAGVGYQF